MVAVLTVAIYVFENHSPPDELTKMNSQMSRIDLLAEMLGPCLAVCVRVRVHV